MKRQTLPKAIICDLDGTIALLQGRSPFDASTAEEDLLNNPVANILEVYSHQKDFEIKIIFVSGRYSRFKPQTEKWLKKHTIRYDKLYLRPDRDSRKDVIYKKEIYENEVKGKYDVLFVLEDRDSVVRMWRDEGLTCLQVAYGAF